MKGTLFLIPSVIAENTAESAFPPANMKIINSLNEFIVEEERTARRFLKSIGYTKSLDHVKLHVHNEHSSMMNSADHVKQLTEGKDMGLLSEAGCPCIADPGSEIVMLCHHHGITVKPLTGPSSILLALMASGLNGQNFSFNGYLPVKKNERAKKIKELETKAYKEKQSQIFMEAPYRNQQLLNDIIKVCNPSTLLCIASELMSDAEFIKTMSVNNWKNCIPELHKKTAIFIIGK
ncbi:MAG: SAM-dependent methyltransferase [Bacteroidota bacterium]